MSNVEDGGIDLKPVLSDDDAQQFESLGYVVIRDVISRQMAEWFNGHILDLVPRSLTFPPEWHVADGRIKPYHDTGEDGSSWDTPELLPLICHETLYRAAAQLLGSARLRSGDGRYRDGSIGITLRNDSGPILSQKLHVDASIPRDAPRALLVAEEVQFGGCYYFADVEPSGGGIHVIPGGHKILAKKVASQKGGWPAVFEEGFFDDFPDTVEITASAGDFVALHHLTPHAASNNRHPRPRVALFVRFLREDNPHYPGQPAPRDMYNATQLRAMGPLGRRLLGVDPW